MMLSEYRKRDWALRAEFARARPVLSFAIEALQFGALMGLALVVLDATPWSLWADAPLWRVGFVLFWAVAMTTSQRTRCLAQPGGRNVSSRLERAE